jgi:AraC-like DNA-binding protein
MPRRKTAPARGLLQTPVPEAARFEHERYHPSGDLAPYIEHFWAVRWDLTGLAPYRAETLPHPSVHLIFDPLGGSRVAGVSRGKFVRMLEGKGGVFAAKFRPGGFSPFAGASLDSFSGTTRPLADIWGTEGDAIDRRVLALEGDEPRIAAVEEFLRSLLPVPDPDAALATNIAETIAGDRTMLAVADLTRRFGLNLRKLQRLFARHIGVNPKWVIQRYRLHEAAEQLARGPVSQSALALELGYADQAHFVKDFKAIVGTSPAAYARRIRRHPRTAP